MPLAASAAGDIIVVSPGVWIAVQKVSMHGHLTCLLGNEESKLLASSMTRLHFPLDFVMLRADNPPDSPLRRAISNRSERSTP
jgi:hypothetical protein